MSDELIKKLDELIVEVRKLRFAIYNITPGNNYRRKYKKRHRNNTYKK